MRTRYYTWSCWEQRCTPVVPVLRGQERRGLRCESQLVLQRETLFQITIITGLGKSYEQLLDKVAFSAK